MVLCSSNLYKRNVDGITHYCCCASLVECICTDYKFCCYVDTLTSSHFKGFLDPVKFHFQGGFSFLTILR